MAILSDDSVDLAELCAVLRQRCAYGRLIGYLQGKTEMRDVLVQVLGYSQLEAEDWVDTLEARGYIAFDGDPQAVEGGDGVWRFSGPTEPPTMVIDS